MCCDEIAGQHFFSEEWGSAPGSAGPVVSLTEQGCCREGATPRLTGWTWGTPGCRQQAQGVLAVRRRLAER